MLARNYVQCIIVNLLYWCYCCLRKYDWWMALKYVTSEHEILEFGRLIPKILGKENM